MSTPIKRKLATILAADVAGYSQLMGADEEGTLRLLAAHRAIIDSIIGLHDGRVVNTAGDSVLAEFTSPVEAVRAATEIQDALRTRNESLPESGRMVFRIGVNLGDVMIKEDDLLGDGVNVAARLQTLAEPGGICISGSVFDQIEGKLSLRFHDIGEQTLKNISRPVRALHLRGPAAKAAAPAPPPPRPRSRHGMIAALTVAGLIALGAAAYLGGLLPGQRDGRQEAAAWDAVKDGGDVAALERYLAAHPEGAHAGEARAKVAGLLASARQAVETQRAEADLARAKADADATRVRAEAEATKLKAEAETAKARAETERQRAEAERAVAAKARADAEAARTPAAPPRPAAAPPAPSAPRIPTAADARESRFDGVWTGELRCPEWRGQTAAWRPQRAQVRNGEMTLDMPLPGRQIGTVTGKVHDDDSVELRGSGIGPGGRPLERVFRGRFAGDTLTAQSDPPGRPCSIQLSRPPAGGRAGG